MSTATLTRPARTSRRAAPAVKEAYAIGYDRLSRFRPDEHAAEITVGNDRQHAENVEGAAPYGGLRERYSDKGKSLSRFRTSDPDDFLAMLDAVRSGRVTHVLIWVLDRILRDDELRVALISACREHGVVIVQTSTGTAIDPNDPDSVFLATILGAVAVLEIEKMSKRIRAFKEARREAGLPHGGKRWFGYEQGNMTPDEIEAPIYRELVGAFLGGATLHTLAKRLTDKGVPTVTGKSVWTAPAVRRILVNPRYAGRSIHKGEDVGAGAWPALVDEATVESVRRKLDNPARRTNNGQNARVYLLAGLGVCATCGADLRGRPLHGSTSKSTEYGARAYACRTGKHVHRSVALVDAVVEALVVERLSRLDLTGALVDDDAADEARALRADRDAVRARLDTLADAYADGALDLDDYKRATARTRAKLAELDDLIGQASERAKAPVAILDGMTGPKARAAWESADLGRRRAIVGLLFTRVALRGGGRGGRPGFEPECVEVSWRSL